MLLTLPDWHPQAILAKHAQELQLRRRDKPEFVNAIADSYFGRKAELARERRESALRIRGHLLDDAFKRIESLGIAEKDQYDWMRLNTPRALPDSIRGSGNGPSYFVYNSALATTAAPVKQPTGTAIRTMMQLRTALSVNARLTSWGCSFDGSAAATPGQVELFENSAAATMSTAYAAADIQPYSPLTALANTAGSTGVPLNLSTTTSGFATAAVTEGTVAAYRGADLLMAPPTGPYVYQWPLGREWEWTPQMYLRARATFGTTINMYIWLLFEL